MPSWLGRPNEAVLRVISASISAISASISASEVASDTSSGAISLGSPRRLWCGPPAFFGRCARRAFCSLLSSAVAEALLPAAPLCGPLALAPQAALL